jgi:lysophospholipase L1-like esterase
MKASPLFLVTLLAVALQVSAAETNHNFAKWEKEIAAYEASDRTNPPPKDAIVFTGASTIRKWTTLAHDFPNLPVLNRGVGGSDIIDITHFADRIIFPYKPRMIFFRSGGNDIHEGRSVAQAFADYKKFVAVVHAKLPKTDIVFISQNPSAARWEQNNREQELNRLVREYSLRTPHLNYCEVSDMVLDAAGQPRLDLFVEDKLHFNAAGYKLLAERVRPFLPAR